MTVSDGFGRYRHWVSEGRVQTRTLQHSVPISTDIRTAGVPNGAPGHVSTKRKQCWRYFQEIRCFCPRCSLTRNNGFKRPLCGRSTESKASVSTGGQESLRRGVLRVTLDLQGLKGKDAVTPPSAVTFVDSASSSAPCLISPLKTRLWLWESSFS